MWYRVFRPAYTSSPRNYNALYRTISRLSFSLDPGGVSRCVPVHPGGVHLYALHRGNVAAAWMARYIYAAAWCSLAALNAARAANGKDLCIFFGFGVIYKYIYIVTPNPRRYARFAICKQTDVSHANRRHGAACMSAGVHPTACGVLRWCVLRVATSGAHPSTQGGHPPVGAPGQGTPPFSEIFFIFFEEGA